MRWPVYFDWDEWKLRENLRKHGIHFEDASLVFDDADRITQEDVPAQRISQEAAMKFHYDEPTDSLYIDLSALPSVDAREISEDLVVDYGEHDRVVGLDIQHASACLDLSKREMEHLPLPLSA